MRCEIFLFIFLSVSFDKSVGSDGEDVQFSRSSTFVQVLARAVP